MHMKISKCLFQNQKLRLYKPAQLLHPQPRSLPRTPSRRKTNQNRLNLRPSLLPKRHPPSSSDPRFPPSKTRFRPRRQILLSNLHHGFLRWHLPHTYLPADLSDTYPWPVVLAGDDYAGLSDPDIQAGACVFDCCVLCWVSCEVLSKVQDQLYFHFGDWSEWTGVRGAAVYDWAGNFYDLVVLYDWRGDVYKELLSDSHWHFLDYCAMCVFGYIGLSVWCFLEVNMSVDPWDVFDEYSFTVDAGEV